MPVVLPESAYTEWLDPANDDVTSLSRLIETGSVTGLRHYPVSLYVNNPKNEGPKCIEPLTTPEPAAPVPLSLPFGHDKPG
jgi:putative SOS response-associated peptidase YedK